MTATYFPSISHGLLPARGAILLLFLALNVGRAEPVVLLPQLITLPANAGKPLSELPPAPGRLHQLTRSGHSPAATNRLGRPMRRGCASRP
jgi:hypothetical protein